MNMDDNYLDFEEPTPEKKDNKKLIIIGVAVVVVLCCCCVGAFLAWNYGDAVLQALGIMN